jgi:hypothetical protein
MTKAIRLKLEAKSIDDLKLILEMCKRRAERYPHKKEEVEWVEEILLIKQKTK